MKTNILLYISLFFFLPLDINASNKYLNPNDSITIKNLLDSIAKHQYRNPIETIYLIEELENNESLSRFKNFEADLYRQKALTLQKLNRDSILFFFKKSIKISKENELHKLFLNTQNNVSSLYKKLGKYQKADSIFSDIFEHSYLKKDTAFKLPFLINYSSLKINMGEPKISASILQEALNLSQSTNDEKYRLFIYHLLGQHSFAQNNYEKALNYNIQSLSFLEEGNQRRYTIYNNIASAYQKLEKLDSSIYYFNKVISGKAAPKSLIYTYNGLGLLHYDNKDYSASLNYAGKCIDLAKRLNRPRNICSCELLEAFSLAELGKHQIALNKLLLLENSVNKYENNDNITSYRQYILSSKLYLSNLPDLAKELDEINTLQDSVKSLKQKEALDEIETKYFKAENEKKIAEQQLAIVQQESTLQKRNYGLLAFGLLSLLLGSIGFNYYKRNRIAKKHNQTLTQKNNQISLLNQDIEHRTANHLKTMMVLIESDIDNSQDSVIQSALLGQQHRLQVVSSIHAQLQHNGDTKNILLGKYLMDLCNYLEDFYLDKYENLSINLDIKTEEGYQIDALDATNLGLIINELVTNAIKYAFEKQENPQIDIELKEANEQLSLSIKDNGIGISSDKIREGAKGLNLVKDLVERLHGTYDMKNLDGLLCSISFHPKTFAYASN